MLKRLDLEFSRVKDFEKHLMLQTMRSISKEKQKAMHKKLKKTLGSEITTKFKSRKNRSLTTYCIASSTNSTAPQRSRTTESVVIEVDRVERQRRLKLKKVWKSSRELVVFEKAGQ